MKKIISDMSKARGKSEKHEGDRVFSWYGGETREDKTNGVVVSVRDFIHVILDNGRDRSFFKDGREFSCNSFPSLFWSQPDITIPERPRRVKTARLMIKPYYGYKDLLEVEAGPYIEPQHCGPEQEIEFEVWEDEDA